jgi:hypothetical protein
MLEMGQRPLQVMLKTHTQAAASHARGITLVAMSHINVTSPTFVHHVGDVSLTYTKSC